jgi:GNAT superfamily N-acetyltransferase
VADWRAEADRWWAGLLQLPEAALHAGGAFAVGHLDHAGVVLVSGAAGPLVYGPPRLLPVLRTTLAGAGKDRVLNGGAWAAALGPAAARLLGPAWYGYASQETLTGAADLAVRPLAEADLPALARLHEQTPPSEVEESGTTGLPAFGYLRDGVLLAVACLGIWQHMPTIGVLTHPQARGQGLGTLVVTAAAAAGLRHRAIVQYRAWHANTASVSLATRAGFTHYCDALAIDLAGDARQG